ncbi:MAG: TonB-dependent receptor, partial [Bacteroidota bacterium]
LFNQINDIHLKAGIELQGDDDTKTHFIQGGLRLRHEQFDDRLNEWERIDSAGYSLPYSETEVLLDQVIKSENDISSLKYTAYLQDSYTSIGDEDQELKLTIGTRLSYWDLNDDFNISPRFQLLYKPSGERDISYKLAGGVYYQTPFYRELRRLDGSLNTQVQAQRSTHLVAGLTRDFIWEKISDRPFRFIAEAYYKSFSDLISYDIDNVRIRYRGENDATGWAVGLDMRLNGEFVPGAESWINLSFLRVRESLDDVQHQRFDSDAGAFVNVGQVPRPSDQFMYFSMFFQDYLPRNENIKVNLTLTFGGGLPFGLPQDNDVVRNTFRFADYRRVDMGFAIQLWNEDWRERKPRHIFRGMRNSWISLEVFNLMGIENVSSNTWVRTIAQQQFAVPNKLTTRRLNLKYRVEF